LSALPGVGVGSVAGAFGFGITGSLPPNGFSSPAGFSVELPGVGVSVVLPGN
jgi:hypothetical protein